MKQGRSPKDFLMALPVQLETLPQLMSILVADQHQNLISGQQAGFTTGNDKIAPTGDGNDNTLLRELDFAQGSAAEGEIIRQLDFTDDCLALIESHHLANG